MQEKRRILFVDDEPAVLDGISRMLHPFRNEWDLSFAGSAKEALDAMSIQPCDVVVSDIIMPGMSGTELLTEIKNRFPTTVRIVLSGQADKSQIFKSVGPIHQYLSKPCEPETLRSTITRACALVQLLENENLRQAVSGMESLPSLPEYYTQLLQELESPNASIKMVKKIVSKDMGMSAKLLQLVNSAFFGMGRKVSDPARAIIFLGLDTIKSLVMSTHVFSQFSDMKLQGVSLDTLWEHSVFCAGLAKRIALSENADDKTREDCFIAGLLHDIGKLVLASKLPQYYNCVLTIMSRNGNRLVEAEQRVFGSSHAEVGAYLLGLWGLNDSVVEAVAFHHFPDKGSAARLTPLVIIFVVNLMMKDNCLDKTRKTLTEMESPYFGDLGLNGRLQTWYDVYEQSLHSGELIDER